ncbi:MAG: D-alanine--D-alanine ligase family protein [Elusimicrobiota bacterium]
MSTRSHPKTSLHVLLVCGGKSAEREVSLASASAILRNLDPRKYSVTAAVIGPSGRWTLPQDPRRAGLDWDYPRGRGRRRVLAIDPARGFSFSLRGRSGGGRAPDVVFPVLHGPNGEDGTIQGMLEFAGLPYVGCGVLSSALGMDKEYPKRLAAQEGVDVLPYAVLPSPRALRERRGWARRVSRLGLPLFVKPARLGSSVGISKVCRRSGLDEALRLAFRFDTKVIVEAGIDAREIEVAVLGDTVRAEASGCGEIRPRAGFYDYEAKYVDPDGAELLIPAPLDRRTARKARAWAVRMFQAVDGYGMARVDFLVDKRSGRLYFNEVNTIPGFTTISLFPRLWGAAGLPFGKLLDRLIALALERQKARSRVRTRL